MMERSVTMTLLSDAIFGSGMSIPGGEDISVKLDETGAPYLSGSTFKGLLRESVENWLNWEARADRADVLEQLFGADGDWNGSPGTRRVFVSPLTLAPGQRLGDLLGQRTFGTRLPIRTFYQPGSMFRIDCESAPSLDCLKQMERAGLGVCREEGWGRVLFLRNLPDIRGRFERTDEGETSKGQRKAASKRRVRAEWLLDEGRAKKLRGKLSKSQLGSVQELLTFAAAHPEPQKRINGTFEGWMTDSAGGINPAKRDLYTPVQNYINSVLEGADLPDSASEWSPQSR